MEIHDDGSSVLCERLVDEIREGCGVWMEPTVEKALIPVRVRRPQGLPTEMSTDTRHPCQRRASVHRHPVNRLGVDEEPGGPVGEDDGGHIGAGERIEGNPVGVPVRHEPKFGIERIVIEEEIVPLCIRKPRAGMRNVNNKRRRSLAHSGDVPTGFHVFECMARYDDRVLVDRARTELKLRGVSGILEGARSSH